MEEADGLSNHLPLSFNRPKDQEYIELLSDAFETNFPRGNPQFTFPAYHMR